MFEAIALLAGALGALAAGAALSPAVRAKLTTLSFWASVFAAAAATSALSQFLVERGHGGTGDVWRHGWPKHFRYERLDWESGARTDAFEPLYFAGNMAAHAAAILLLWLAWRTARATIGRR